MELTQADLDNPERYYDLSKVFENIGGYSDFEGFADPQPTLALLELPEVKNALLCYQEEQQELIRDLVVHWAYENIDQADYTPNESDTFDFVHAVGFVLQSRWIMKRGAK